MADLIAELAEVVEKIATYESMDYSQERAWAYNSASDRAVELIRTHHAELKAAVRDCQGEREVSYQVWQDDMPVAASDDLADAMHYLAMYGQDGPCHIERVVSYRQALDNAMRAEG